MADSAVASLEHGLLEDLEVALLAVVGREDVRGVPVRQRENVVDHSVNDQLLHDLVTLDEGVMEPEAALACCLDERPGAAFHERLDGAGDDDHVVNVVVVLGVGIVDVADALVDAGLGMAAIVAVVEHGHIEADLDQLLGDQDNGRLRAAEADLVQGIAVVAQAERINNRDLHNNLIMWCC